MRIVHLVAMNRWTGAADPAFTLARDLARAGQTVTFICTPGKVLADRLRGVELDVRTDIVLDTKGDVLRAPWAIRRLNRFLENERIEILHCHLGADHWLAYIARRFGRCDWRLVRTIHRRRTLEGIGRGFLLGGSGADVYVHLHAGNVHVHQERFPEAAGKMHLVHGAADEDRFHPGLRGDAIRSEFGLGPEDLVVGIVARFVPGRGHDLLMRTVPLVLQRFPQAAFLLVGRGPLRDQFEQRVREMGVSDRVLFAGYRDEDFPEVYAAMDIQLCLALGAEESARAALEGMACGNPLVATRVGPLPEMIDDGRSGRLVPNGNPQALAAAILEFLQDSDRRSAVAETSRQVYDERFTSHIRVEKTLAVYKGILR